MSSVIVLESPWEPDNHDANRLSVIPFAQGVANIVFGKFFSATFYDAKSLSFALKKFANSTHVEDPIVYIASHGTRGRLGTPDGFADINIRNLTDILSDVSDKVKGVMLGCCLLGSNDGLVECFEGAQKLSWVFGYTCEVDWFFSSMVDMAILYSVLVNGAGKGTVIDSVAQAIAMFNSQYINCDHNNQSQKYALADSFKLYVNDGRRKYWDVTEEVKSLCGWDQ